MPVIRSSSIISIRSSNQSRKSTSKPSSEIILISDDDRPVQKRPSQKPRAKSKVQAKPAETSEILEISSDDDKPPVPRRPSPIKSSAALNAIRNLRSQIFYLEKVRIYIVLLSNQSVLIVVVSRTQSFSKNIAR